MKPLPAGKNHMYTWSFAYSLTGIGDWLFSKTQSGAPADYRFPPVHTQQSETARSMMTAGLADLAAKDYPKALAAFHQAAEAGSFKAGRYIGLCYANGWGTIQDMKQAADWYQQAAEQGDITAAYNLGKCYETGQGRVQDNQQAFAWYYRSAARGDKIAAPAMYALADLYEAGRGVAADQSKAAYYRKKADSVS